MESNQEDDRDRVAGPRGSRGDHDRPFRHLVEAVQGRDDGISITSTPNDPDHFGDHS